MTDFSAARRLANAKLKAAWAAYLAAGAAVNDADPATVANVRAAWANYLAAHADADTAKSRAARAARAARENSWAAADADYQDALNEAFVIRGAAFAAIDAAIAAASAE